MTPSPTLTWDRALPVIGPDNAGGISLLQRLAINSKNNDIGGMGISPDSSLLAVASSRDQKSNFLIEIWDVASRSLRMELRGHSKWVPALDFSPDGSLLASGGDDHTIIIWRIGDGARLTTISPGFAIVSLAFSPDGKYLAAGSYQRGLKIFRTSDWSLEKSIPLGSWSYALGLSFSPDSGKLAVAVLNAPSMIISLETGDVLFALQEKYCSSVRYSTMEERVFLGCMSVSGAGINTVFSNRIIEWHPADNTVVEFPAGDCSVGDLNLSPDEQLAIFFSECRPQSSTIRILGIPGGNELYRLDSKLLADLMPDNPQAYLYGGVFYAGAALSPNGRFFLAVAGGSSFEALLFGVKNY